MYSTVVVVGRLSFHSIIISAEYLFGIPTTIHLEGTGLQSGVSSPSNSTALECFSGIGTETLGEGNLFNG